MEKFWEISGLSMAKKKGGVGKIVDDMNNGYQNLGAAEYLNNYYTNAGPNLAKKMTSDWKSSDNLSTISVFEFGFIPEACVQRLLSDIKMSKSSIVDSLGETSKFTRAPRSPSVPTVS